MKSFSEKYGVENKEQAQSIIDVMIRNAAEQIVTSPNRGSWNGRWSQEDRLHARVYDQRSVPKVYWNKDFYYTWDDGWTACVEVRQVSAAEGRRLREKSSGFCGYDWMIQSILENGKIVLNKEKEK